MGSTLSEQLIQKGHVTSERADVLKLLNRCKDILARSIRLFIVSHIPAGNDLIASLEKELTEIEDALNDDKIGANLSSIKERLDKVMDRLA